MRKAALVIAPLLLFLAGQARAQEAPWRISEVTGDVRIVDSGQAHPATRGALLSSGATVATGAGAHAVLIHGGDYVMVSPNSRVRVPTAQQHGASGLIQMLTDWGTALFRIEHRAAPHFGVQTPYLAAVVKGTVFTVTVGQAGASVQVTQGAVEVSTVDGGAADMVRPGSIATVASGDLRQLNIEGETHRSIRSSGAPAAGVQTVPAGEAGAYSGPADADVAVAAPVTEDPVSLQDATGGLVQGAPAAAAHPVQDAHQGDQGAHSDAAAADHGHDHSAPPPAQGDDGPGAPGHGGSGAAHDDRAPPPARGDGGPGHGGPGHGDPAGGHGAPPPPGHDDPGTGGPGHGGGHDDPPPPPDQDDGGPGGPGHGGGHDDPPPPGHADDGPGGSGNGGPGGGHGDPAGGDDGDGGPGHGSDHHGGPGPGHGPGHGNGDPRA